MRIPLTIWMNMPTFYQADIFRALLATGGIDLEVVFARPLAGERQALGWTSDVDGFVWRTLPPGPGGLLAAARLAWASRRRTHIVNGIWAEPAFTAALLALMAGGASFAIYAEAPQPGLRRAPHKRVLRRALGWLAVRRARGLLPVADAGARFFGRLGADPGRIYPFGYFRAAPAPPPVADERPEVIYVGQLVERKGLDQLLAAWAGLPRGAERLVLVGSGPGQLGLERMVAERGLAGCVSFAGALPVAAIPGRLAGARLLVLPSRWDGWGLVVNEALAAGVPVLVSDQCGAADLIEPGRNGWIFRAGDLVDLRAQLACALAADPAALRAGALASAQAISAQAVAPYLLAVLRHMRGEQAPRPTPPWASRAEGRS